MKKITSILLISLMTIIMYTSPVAASQSSSENMEHSSIVPRTPCTGSHSVKSWKEKNSTVKVDDSSSKDIVIVENMYPISDIETLDKFNQLLPLEETTQEQPSYEEIPIYNNFYIVPDIIHDDRILMEKILNNEVILLINPTYGQMVEK